MGCTSERMGAVGADRELDLKEQFVGRLAVGVLTAPDLAPKLGEFAWPEGENKGLAPVCLRGIVGMPGRLHPRPREPALRELVLTGEEPAVGHLVPERIPAPAPDELAPERGGAVRRGSQRFPPQGRIDSLEARLRPRRQAVRPPAAGE